MLIYHQVTASISPPNVRLLQQQPEDSTLPLAALATCQVDTAIMSVPVLEDIQIQGTVKGWAGDRCVLHATLLSVNTPEQPVDYMTCYYSRETLAMLTAASTDLPAQTDSTSIYGRRKKLSKALSQECQFKDPALQRIFSN
jgi:hypothetical protein